MDVSSTPKSQNVTFAVETQNRFLPIQGWDLCDQTPINLSQGPKKGGLDNSLNMPVQDVMNNSADVSEKLSFIVNKLEKLDRNDKDILSVTRNLTSNLCEAIQRVDCLEHAKSVSDIYFKMLAYHSIDLEARSRRSNLIFYGLADLDDENTYHVLTDFFSDYLDLDLSEFFIQRIHRLGSLSRARAYSQITRRPIIVAFRDYGDTEYILDRAKLLKDTRFGIDRDYPKEIASARKKLWPLYLENKKLRKDVKIAYPAKLIVNGKVVADEFPSWHEILQKDRCAFLEDMKIKNYSVPNHSVYSVETEIGSASASLQMDASNIHQNTFTQDTTVPVNENSGFSNSSGIFVSSINIPMMIRPMQQTIPDITSSTTVVDNNNCQYTGKSMSSQIERTVPSSAPPTHQSVRQLSSTDQGQTRSRSSAVNNGGRRINQDNDQRTGFSDSTTNEQ
jgi:hypothetical protein